MTIANTNYSRAAELLVSDRATNRVLAFDASSGAFSRVVVASDPSNLFSPAAMTIGFGGDLFVASQGTGKILRYDINTGAPKGSTPGSPVFADLGIASGPGGLLFDGTRLFVGTVGNADSNQVQILNSAGANIGTITGGPLAGRTGMALDGSGNLFVNSFNTDGFSPVGGETGAVLKFNGPSFATFSTVKAGDGVYQNEFFNVVLPVNLAGMYGLVVKGNSLFTSSLFGQEVLKLDQTTGAVQAVIGTQFTGQPLPPTAYPAGLLIDASGNLLVSTLGNNNPNDPIYDPDGPGQGNPAILFPGSVQKFNPDTGEFLGVLIAQGDALNQQPGVGFLPTAMVLSPVPEPATILLFAAVIPGVLLLGWQRRKSPSHV